MPKLFNFCGQEIPHVLLLTPFRRDSSFAALPGGLEGLTGESLQVFVSVSTSSCPTRSCFLSVLARVLISLLFSDPRTGLFCTSYIILRTVLVLCTAEDLRLMQVRVKQEREAAH